MPGAGLRAASLRRRRAATAGWAAAATAAAAEGTLSFLHHQTSFRNVELGAYNLNQGVLVKAAAGRNLGGLAGRGDVTSVTGRGRDCSRRTERPRSSTAPARRPKGRDRRDETAAGALALSCGAGAVDWRSSAGGASGLPAGSCARMDSMIRYCKHLLSFSSSVSPRRRLAFGEVCAGTPLQIVAAPPGPADPVSRPVRTPLRPLCRTNAGS